MSDELMGGLLGDRDAARAGESPASQGCDCEHARANLEELIRGELRDTDCGPIRAHLAECTECRNEQQVFEKLTVAVQRACEGPAPASLRETILATFTQLHTGSDG